MPKLDREDWTDWWGKLKWQLISFKFLSFWTCITMLILAWLSLIQLYERSIDVAKDLYKHEYIAKEDVSKIVTHTMTTLFDSALSHILIFAGATLTCIVAVKGVSYYTNSKQTSEVIRKLDGDTTKEDLKKFLPKRGN